MKEVKMMKRIVLTVLLLCVCTYKPSIKELVRQLDEEVTLFFLSFAKSDSLSLKARDKLVAVKTIWRKKDLKTILDAGIQLQTAADIQRIRLENSNYPKIDSIVTSIVNLDRVPDSIKTAAEDVRTLAAKVGYYRTYATESLFDLAMSVKSTGTSGNEYTWNRCAPW
jgi:hypothetical protein